MDKLLNLNNKATGDILEASYWNSVVDKINELVDSANETPQGNGGGTPIDTSGIITLSGSNLNNVTIGSNKHINLEPAWDKNVLQNTPPQTYSGNYGDIALKPGDDILFCSHHRKPNKRDKIVLKNIDGSDNPVKLEVHSGEINLSVKNKDLTKKKDSSGEDTNNLMFKAENAKVLDVNIITGNVLDLEGNNERDERGYLKVRAQAIDLRCEKHGGIALQPKGYDSNGNMNKIKFEHGGGDGLEFGTFNSEKTSIFTDEYRFNKNGIWKMSTRDKEASGKTILDERENGLQGLPATGAYKYKKNNSTNNAAKALETGKTYESPDDFYDFIDTSDEQCTTKDIIKTANAFNGGKNRHVKVTQNGNIEIVTNITYSIHLIEGTPESSPVGEEPNLLNSPISGDLSDIINPTDITNLWKGTVFEGDIYNANDLEFTPDPELIYYYLPSDLYFKFIVVESPNINIESEGNIKIKSEGKIELKGELDFGSKFNFGETDEGIEVLYKLTKKNNGTEKDCGILKVVALNNHATNNLVIENIYDYSDPQNPSNVTIAPGESEVVASCSILDVIRLVNYMKYNKQGPWEPQQSPL